MTEHRTVDDHDGKSTIVLKTRMNPLTVTMYFVLRPVVTVDDTRSFCKWGETTFHVNPGLHEVRVSLGDALFRPLGEASISVQVASGTTVYLRYSAPYLLFSQGRIREVSRVTQGQR